MIKFIEPNELYLESYIEAYNENVANNIKTNAFANAQSEDILKRYTDYKNEYNLPSGYVGASYYWLVNDELKYFIGEISIRHRLTEALHNYGGHIGYGIRYKEWNKGYGTLILKHALEKAKELGIDQVLITCDDDNIASAKVMENNGFHLKDKIKNNIDGHIIITRRYLKSL